MEWFEHLMIAAFFYLWVSTFTIGALLFSAHALRADTLARRKTYPLQIRDEKLPLLPKGAHLLPYLRTWAVGVALIFLFGAAAVALELLLFLLDEVGYRWILLGMPIQNLPFIWQISEQVTEGTGTVLLLTVYFFFGHKAAAICALRTLKRTWRREEERTPGKLPIDSVGQFLTVSLVLYGLLYVVIVVCLLAPAWVFGAPVVAVVTYLLLRMAFPREARMLRIRRLLWGRQPPRSAARPNGGQGEAASPAG